MQRKIVWACARARVPAGLSEQEEQQEVGQEDEQEEGQEEEHEEEQEEEAEEEEEGGRRGLDSTAASALATSDHFCNVR